MFRCANISPFRVILLGKTKGQCHEQLCDTGICLYGTETLALTELQQRMQVCENNGIRKIAIVERAVRRRASLQASARLSTNTEEPDVRIAIPPSSDHYRTTKVAPNRDHSHTKITLQRKLIGEKNIHQRFGGPWPPCPPLATPLSPTALLT